MHSVIVLFSTSERMSLDAYQVWAAAVAAATAASRPDNWVWHTCPNWRKYSWCSSWKQLCISFPCVEFDIFISSPYQATDATVNLIGLFLNGSRKWNLCRGNQQSDSMVAPLRLKRRQRRLMSTFTERHGQTAKAVVDIFFILMCLVFFAMLLISIRYNNYFVF